ncbi:unnamed protein product, partial [Polarella glacialis]
AEAAEAKGEQMMKNGEAAEARVAAAASAAKVAQAKADKELASAQSMSSEASQLRDQRKQALQDAETAKEQAVAEETTLEDDNAGSWYLKLALFLATAVSWASVAGLLWSRIKHRELHSHHLSMIVQLNEDRLKCHERLQMLGMGLEEQGLGVPLLGGSCPAQGG